MSFLDFDELILADSMNIDSLNWTGARLACEYGDGYGDEAVVGSVAGVRRWALSAGVLPADDAYGNLVDGTNRFDYYYEFFKSHTTGDQAVFVIEFRGRKYFASFVEPTIDFERFTEDLFAGGVEIRQRRVAGFLEGDDGSVFHPADVTGLQAWYAVRSDSNVVTLPDLSGNDRTLTGELPMPDVTTNGGVDVFRWNGTNDNPLAGNDAFVISHLFIVACATDATFDASPLRGLVSGATLGILVSEASTTKFTDLAYGAAFEYKKNGTPLADNNAQCSMSGVLAVLECKFPATAGIDGALVIGTDRSFGTRIWKGDFAYLLAYNNAGMSAADEYRIRQFIARECGAIAVVE